MPDALLLLVSTELVREEDLVAGDLIFGVNGKRVADIAELRDYLTKIPDGSPVVLQLQRDGVLRYIILRGE